MPSGMNTAGKVLAIIGALCQLGPFVGLTGTVIGMIKAFDNLGTSGTGDPATLSAGIGEVLISTAAGLAVSLVGAVLLLTGIYLFNYRQKWARVLLIIVGIIWFLALLGLGTQQLLSRNAGHSSQPRSADSWGAHAARVSSLAARQKAPSLSGVPAALHRLAPLPFRRAAETYMRAACAPHEP